MKHRLIYNPTMVEISTLSLAPWNYKAEPNADTLARFTRSLSLGVVTPIVVAECKEAPGITEVCDGNHRVSAFSKMGLTQIPAIHCGTLTLEERKSIALRHNGKWFHDLTLPLAECLKSIQDLQEDIEALPYDEVELDQLLAALSMDLDTSSSSEEEEELVEAQPKSAKTRKEKSVKRVECPHCGKEFVL